MLKLKQVVNSLIWAVISLHSKSVARKIKSSPKSQKRVKDHDGPSGIISDMHLSNYRSKLDFIVHLSFYSFVQLWIFYSRCLTRPAPCD